MKTSFSDVAKKGSYYYPAHTHYGRETIVTCDRCAKANLKACVGYVDIDLCLECISTVINQLDVQSQTNNVLSNHSNAISDRNVTVTEKTLTRMRSRIFDVYKSDESDESDFENYTVNKKGSSGLESDNNSKQIPKSKIYMCSGSKYKCKSKSKSK